VEDPAQRADLSSTIHLLVAPLLGLGGHYNKDDPAKERALASNLPGLLHPFGAYKKTGFH